jgi:hypothetical protein
MARLPDTVSKAWAAREGPVVLTTVDKKGVPNGYLCGLREQTR